MTTQELMKSFEFVISCTSPTTDIQYGFTEKGLEDLSYDFGEWLDENIEPEDHEKNTTQQNFAQFLEDQFGDEVWTMLDQYENKIVYEVEDFGGGDPRYLTYNLMFRGL